MQIRRLLVIMESSLACGRLTKSGIINECFSVLHVESLSVAFNIIKIEQFDACLLDLHLSTEDGLHTLQSFLAICRSIPVLAIVDEDAETLGYAALATGAQDYLLKSDLGRLSNVKQIDFAISRKASELSQIRLKALEQKEQSLSMLAHDLKSPLLGCQRVLKLMLDGAVQELKEQEKLFQLMSNANSGLLLLIDNLLESYRMNFTSHKLDLESTDVSEVTKACVQQLAPIAQSKAITIEDKCTQGSFVYADRLALSRVIINLLSNSIKFTQCSGLIELSFHSHNGTGSLFVKDSGIGIGEDKLNKIFDQFFQCADNDRIHGYGLGLHISKQLVEQQYGDLICKSSPNAGTVFEIRLPCFG
jgi:two-component system sensor histidine kinase/response regulator